MARKGKKRSNRTVTIGGHTRSPRGPNKGKKPVRVKGYTRRKPKSKR